MLERDRESQGSAVTQGPHGVGDAGRVLLKIGLGDGTATYRAMFTIRRFEERCQALREDEKIAGSIHLSCGQEAIPVGALQALRGDDRVLATYRGHGWAIACGIPLEALFAEILGRATGTNGGRAGSAYLSSPENGFLGENSIVGAGVPIACGVALAAELEVPRSGRVTVVSFGDGATSQGAVHEGFVTAAARSLPVVFVCENNGWSENTPIGDIARVEPLARRADGYGFPGVSVDGNDPKAVRTAVAVAADRARGGRGPTLVECRTIRLLGHYNGDIEHYRPREDREAAAADDPLPRLRKLVISADGGSDSAVLRLEEEVEVGIDAALALALAAPPADAATARDHVVSATGGRTLGAVLPSETTSTMRYGSAVNEALRRELSARPEAVVFGEDIAVPGGVFGVTRNLQRDFGSDRVFDTPIAESAILGMAVGASQEGLTPIVEIMWSDFLLVALDQLVNQAANVRYLHRGERSAPFVVRCQQGVTPGSCAQHSQSLEALLAHIPGLLVGMPSTAQDAYAMLRAAVAHPDPCILIESRALYLDEGSVDLDGPVEQVGGARVIRSGADVTLISWGRMTNVVLEAADLLAAAGVDATVVDLRWLTPLDRDAIGAAASRTGRVVVAHEANLTGGFGGEVVATVVERSFHDLDVPPLRLGAADIRFPSAPTLQQALWPDATQIATAARTLVSS